MEQAVQTFLRELTKRMSWAGEVKIVPITGGLAIVPRSLIAALWLQFADAVCRGKKFRRCKLAECERVWFEIRPDVKRTDSDYCSPECRHKAYRDRKGEAYRLHLQGMPLPKIASRLETHQSVIKGWIEKASRRKR